jgi:quinoprotein relay system zinc metallohydrolase 2
MQPPAPPPATQNFSPPPRAPNPRANSPHPLENTRIPDLKPVPFSRRNLLTAGLCLCCLPTRLRADAPLSVQEVAPGIHIRRGLDEDASPTNNDAIANIGFIIGTDSVLVTDPGGCLADGARLRAAVRATTAKPIRYVLLSHIHPDHIFGAGAFAQDNPVFIGHQNLPASLASRGDFYQSHLNEILGPNRAGPLVHPTLTIASEQKIDLGNRPLTLTAHQPAHTSTDVSLFDHTTGTLLPADLLFVGRIPSLDGSLNGWLAQLPTLTAQKPARAIPGHGPVSMDPQAAITPLTRYLSALRAETRAAIAAGHDITAATATVAQSERPNWKLFDDYNARNVTEAYKELEWE